MTEDQIAALEALKLEERTWRNKELLDTDWIMPLTDHPERVSHLLYRTSLRDYPSLATFPSASSRPTL